MSQTPSSIIREPFILEAGQLETGESLYIRGEVRADGSRHLTSSS